MVYRRVPIRAYHGLRQIAYAAKKWCFRFHPLFIFRSASEK